MPVWRFVYADQLHLVGKSLWGITKTGGLDSRSNKLQRFQISANSIVSEIREAYRTSDVVPFRSGDSVRIDVSQLPPAQQAPTRTALKQSLEQSGYVVDKTASVKAVATLGEVVERDVTYLYGKDSQTIDYRRQKAELFIEKDGQRLWTRSKAHIPPGWVLMHRLDDESFVGEWGKPDCSLYSSKIPTFMRKPGSTGYLGQTKLGRTNSNQAQSRQIPKTKSVSSRRKVKEAASSVGSFKEVVNPFVN